MEKQKTKASAIIDAVFYALAAAALGSIVAIPYCLIRLANTVEEASMIYYAIEACYNGANLEICDKIGG